MLGFSQVRKALDNHVYLGMLSNAQVSVIEETQKQHMLSRVGSHIFWFTPWLGFEFIDLVIEFPKRPEHGLKTERQTPILSDKELWEPLHHSLPCRKLGWQRIYDSTVMLHSFAYKLHLYIYISIFGIQYHIGIPVFWKDQMQAIIPIFSKIFFFKMRTFQILFFLRWFSRTQALINFV